MIAVLGCAPAKKEGDWVDQKWSSFSVEWRRGYRDYFSDVSKDYKDALREIDMDLWNIRLCQKYEYEYESDSMGSDIVAVREIKQERKADLEREIAKLQQEVKAKTQVSVAAKKKLEGTANTSDYWDGWKVAECEINNAVSDQEFREDKKSREEGEHLKKVLEYAK
jgi:hypothetical protein